MSLLRHSFNRAWPRLRSVDVGLRSSAATRSEWGTACPYCSAVYQVFSRSVIRSSAPFAARFLAVSTILAFLQSRSPMLTAILSESAMLQHRNAPSHNTLFKCDKGERHCRSKQSLVDHQRAFGHTVTQLTVVSIPAGWPKGRNSSGIGSTGSWKVNSIIGQLMNMLLDEDRTLCDKDRVWCGHCAESYDLLNLKRH